MKTSGLILLVSLYACAGTKEAKQTSHQSLEKMELKKQEKSTFDESFDPLILNDDDWVVQKKYRGIKEQIEASVEKNTVRTDPEKNLKEQIVFGFRVQLYSTTDYYMALTVRDEAGSKIGDDIYVDYEQPYYKIRAGNFTERDKAEAAKNLAKSLGYADAWVVQTNVLLKEQ